MTLSTITDEQITQVLRHAVNDVTRALAVTGCRLTFDQLDQLDEPTIAWLRTRLGLRTVAYSDYAENLGLALCAARELAEMARRQGANHAGCRQLIDNIDGWVGEWVWSDDRNKYVMRWPAQVVAAANGYGRAAVRS